MTEHTPGPWHTTGDFVGMQVQAPGRDGRTIDVIARLPRHAEVEANARLIAAAPYLLGALMAMRDALSEMYQDGLIEMDSLPSYYLSAERAADASIAKARGIEVQA